MVLGLNGYGMGENDRTEGGNPIPKAGELRELQYDGGERFQLRIERLVGYSVVGSAQSLETRGWRRNYQISLSHWDTYHPQKVDA
jgi:hypothetical protein